MSAALAYPELESAIAQLVTADAHPDGWEAVLGYVVRDLWGAVASGRVPRPLAVQRIARALQMWTSEDDAWHLAGILPARGWQAPTAQPVVPVRELLEPPERPPEAPPAPDAAPRGPLIDVCRFDSVKDRRPKAGRVPWPRLAQRLTRFEVFPSKDAAPLWSPVRYRSGTVRGKANVELVTALVLDFDDGTTWDAILPRWDGCAAVVHTSWSHAAELTKWRLVIPLARPVPGPKWGPVWAWAAQRSGLAPDEKCKDASRIYFVPSIRDATWPREAFVVDGAPLEIPLDVLEPVTRRANPVVDAGWKGRAERSAEQGRRGELYRVDAGARLELGTRLGGQVVSNGSAIKGVRCPKCGRASVSWWVALGTEIQARCNHKGSCGARFWLDELEAAT